MLSSPAPKTEPAASGPFDVFETAAAPVQRGHPSDTFADSIDRALQSSGSGSVQGQPVAESAQAGSNQAPAKAESANPKQPIARSFDQPENLQQPLDANTQTQQAEASGLAEMASPTGDDLVEDEENASSSPEQGPTSSRNEPIVLDTLCSLLLMSVVVPPPAPPPTAIPSPRDETTEQSFLAGQSADSNLIQAQETPAFSQPGQDGSPENKTITQSVQPMAKGSPAPQSIIEMVSTSTLSPQSQPQAAAEGANIPDIDFRMEPEPGPCTDGSTALKPPPSSTGTPASSVLEERNIPSIASSGTAVAKKDLQMKKTAENVNNSPSGDLMLPSAATSSARAAVSAVSILNRLKEPSSQDFDRLAALSAFTQNSAPASDVAQVESFSQVEPKSVESLEQKILHSAIEMKRLGSDSMSVVLRPDNQTELHLSLAVNNGQVEVEAKISRGDTAHLQAQWGTLQQNLAQQGIRLQPMGQTQDFAQQGDGNSGGSSQFQRRDSGESERRKTMLEEEMASSQFQFTARTAAGRRLWESWA